MICQEAAYGTWALHPFQFVGSSGAYPDPSAGATHIHTHLLGFGFRVWAETPRKPLAAQVEVSP